MDPKVKTSIKCRTVLHEFVFSLRYKQDDDTIDLLGCSAIELAEHLNKTAINNGYIGFDIYDYDHDLYHLDHINPLKLYIDGLATLEDICYYTNIQILKKQDNLLKGSNYD